MARVWPLKPVDPVMGPIYPGANRRVCAVRKVAGALCADGDEAGVTQAIFPEAAER